MARAKRTDRTEARRRYRADQAAALGEGEGVDDADYPADNAAEAPRRKGTAPESSTAKSAPPPARPQRPSFTESAKAAYHQPHIAEDLRHLPRLLIHWSVLLSAGLALVGTILLVTQGTTKAADGTVTGTSLGYIGGLMFSLFVGVPPFGASLLIGFMLPRATYLVGLVYGLFAYILLVVFFLAQPADSTVAIGADYFLSALGLMVIGTMFFTAGIAWYRRFLDLLNPARAQRAQAQKKAQAQGRGNAPRNRLSGSSR